MTPHPFRRHDRPRKPIPFRRGVAILPSVFTLANMFCGYYAIIKAFKHQFEWAVMLIVIAGILDSLDGRIARMTGSTSDFGKELDSLTDFLSFGVAPALILYHWGFKDLGRTGWLFAFLLPVAGAMRLARFNVLAGKADKRYFVGLPIPAAGAAAVLPLYFLSSLPDNAQIAAMRADEMSEALFRAQAYRVAALVYVVALSWLMVSRIRYRSFKELDVSVRRPSTTFFLMALVIVLVALNPPAVLLGMALTYTLSGPAGWVWGRISRKPTEPESAPTPAPTEEAVPHEG
jgi:CDP-diacylglycerol---serine O-phosphatidyltransferase